MTRVHQVSSLIIIAFSIWMVVESVQLNYYTPLGPGPGFFPLWLALSMAGLSTAWFIQLTFHPLQGKAIHFLPSRAGCWRIASLIVSVAVFGLLVERVGFSVLMFVFLLFLLTALGRKSALVTLAVSILGSFGAYYVFSHYLNVRLPQSGIEFLRSLGF